MREREKEREQPPCPLAQRVCVSASVADGASEYAITTLMTDISLTLEPIPPHGKEQSAEEEEEEEEGRRGRLAREKKKKRKKLCIHLMPDHNIMTQSLLCLLVGNTRWCRKQL